VSIAKALVPRHHDHLHKEATNAYPTRIGIEQRISEEGNGSQVLARFSAGLAPAQAVRITNPEGVAILFGRDNGPTSWGIDIRIILDDGTMTPTKVVGNYAQGNASGTDWLKLIITEQMTPPPPDTWFGGLIEALMYPLGSAVLHPPGSSSSWNLAIGTYHPVDSPPPSRESVFRPTVSHFFVGELGYLVMWHVGSEATSQPHLRRTDLWGCLLDPRISTSPAIHKFELVSLGDAGYNSGVQAFRVAIPLPLDAEEQIYMETFGYAFANGNRQIVVKIFDMAMGAFLPGSNYVSQIFPGPGMEVATSHDSEPAVAWINCDDGNVMVSFSQMVPPDYRTMVFKDPIVANKPLVRPHLGNRRPALAMINTRNAGGIIAVLWEGYEINAAGYPAKRSRPGCSIPVEVQSQTNSPSTPSVPEIN
jgi:hypothetical protein